MVADVNKELLPEPKPRVIKLDDAKGHNIYEESQSSEIKQVVKTNDIILLADGPREPGESLRWHTHMPTLYQITIVIQGTLRVHYKDEDENAQYIDVSEGEVAFLPGGLENKIETVGDTPVKHFTIEPDMPINRVEHLIGDEDHLNVYDPSKQTPSLTYDTNRNTVVEIDEDAVR